MALQNRRKQEIQVAHYPVALFSSIWTNAHLKEGAQPTSPEDFMVFKPTNPTLKRAVKKMKQLTTGERKLLELAREAVFELEG